MISQNPNDPGPRRPYRGATSTAAVDAELKRLNCPQLATFHREYEALVESPAGVMPAQSARVVADVKRWTGDPLAGAWGAVADAIEMEAAFLRIVRKLHP